MNAESVFAGMVWADYVILGIVALSALIGLIRGLIREALSLGAWVAALLVAWLYHRQVADALVPWISTPSIRIAVAFVVLILVVLVLGALVGFLLSKLVEKTGLTGTDRLLGLVFGLVRGALLAAVLVYLAALTPLAEDPWWRQSMLIGRFQVLAEQVLAMIPPDIVERFKQF